jgi:SNF2 family DNA or RNA helicase
MPIETGGGILADDMGLGKTLTMLSAVISTKDEAKAFADHEETNCKLRTDNTPIRSRATLVVVPTPSRFSHFKDISI